MTKETIQKVYDAEQNADRSEVYAHQKAKEVIAKADETAAEIMESAKSRAAAYFKEKEIVALQEAEEYQKEVNNQITAEKKRLIQTAENKKVEVRALITELLFK